MVTHLSRRSASSFVLLAVTVVLATIALPRTVAANDTRIALLSSEDAVPYKEVLKGVQQSLGAQGVTATFDEYPLQGNAGKASQAIQEAKQKGTTLLVTVGTLATQTAIKAASDIPIVAALIPNPDDLKAGNATGVSLDFSPETQFQWLQRLLPDTKTVGVIFNPKKSASRIEAATQAARSLGLTLVTKQAETPQALTDALNSLANEVKVLWAITDSTLFSPQTAESVLLFSFRNRIPVAGLSTSWVKAGALYALDRDYLDLGAQCGEMAGKILQGAKANALPPTTPRKVMYVLNLKTATHLKLNIAQPLIDGAQQVFK
ncbi:MAG: ABC transporter substrate-binding protein [Deltaproteobacteria bacterium]|nr:ABC transporter substrate-binding protein [Deltaproteobacteria bacterium]